MSKKIYAPRAWSAPLAVLVLGAGCLWLAYALLNGFGIPGVFMNFVRKPDGTLPLYFYNMGKTDVVLDAQGMRRVLFSPLKGDAFLLRVESGAFGASEAENSRRLLTRKTLAHGESFEIGDIRSVVALLPDSDLTLTAVYLDSAGNEVRSLPLILREEKP